MYTNQQVTSNQRRTWDGVPGELTETERLFARFKRRRLWDGVWGWASRRSATLHDLESAVGANTSLSSRDAGEQTVSLDRIIGTVERSRTFDFDSDFRPISDHSKQRWVAVATLFRRGRYIPPVDLIQYGESYFVIDGHHRVSAAKALGWSRLQAQVTVVE